ncbi:MAG: hypothetical protein FWE72_01535 [Spirochaetaceae bacterium]|nr:hypothetical protein [Spirochaetaceae bacterium]
MELKIEYVANTMDICLQYAEKFFKNKLHLKRENMSVFESYRLYPMERVHINGLWKYRIVHKEGKYFLGEIANIK